MLLPLEWAEVENMARPPRHSPCCDPVEVAPGERMTSVAALKPVPPPHYSLLTQSHHLSSYILLPSLSKGCALNLCLDIFLTGREKETDGGHSPSGPAKASARRPAGWQRDDRWGPFPCVQGRLPLPDSVQLAKQGELPRQTAEVWKLTASDHCGVKWTHEMRHQGCCLE